MKMLFRFFLASGRKCRRRRMVAGLALWLLRLLRDVENDDMLRNSGIIDRFDSGLETVSRREYDSVEEACLSSECTMGFLDSAIEELEFAY